MAFFFNFFLVTRDIFFVGVKQHDKSIWFMNAEKSTREICSTVHHLRKDIVAQCTDEYGKKVTDGACMGLWSMYKNMESMDNEVSCPCETVRQKEVQATGFYNIMLNASQKSASKNERMCYNPTMNTDRD